MNVLQGTLSQAAHAGAANPEVQEYYWHKGVLCPGQECCYMLHSLWM